MVRRRACSGHDLARTGGSLGTMWGASRSRGSGWRSRQRCRELRHWGDGRRAWVLPRLPRASLGRPDSPAAFPEAGEARRASALTPGSDTWRNQRWRWRLHGSSGRRESERRCPAPTCEARRARQRGGRGGGRQPREAWGQRGQAGRRRGPSGEDTRHWRPHGTRLHGCPAPPGGRVWQGGREGSARTQDKRGREARPESRGAGSVGVGGIGETQGLAARPGRLWWGDPGSHQGGRWRGWPATCPGRGAAWRPQGTDPRTACGGDAEPAVGRAAGRSRAPCSVAGPLGTRPRPTVRRFPDSAPAWGGQWPTRRAGVDIAGGRQPSSRTENSSGRATVGHERLRRERSDQEAKGPWERRTSLRSGGRALRTATPGSDRRLSVWAAGGPRGVGVPLTRAHGRAWEASGHFSVVARPLLKENTNHPESGLFWKVVTRPELKGKTLWQETRPVSAAWKLFRHRSGRRLDTGTRTGLPRRPRRRDAGSPAGRARCRAGDSAPASAVR